MVASQKIEDKDYIIQFDADSERINFQGELSLNGPKDYTPITVLLNEVAESEPETMTIDLRNLSFVNSSGISMLSKFVLSIRKKKSIQLIILGSSKMPWQGKSLKNLEKLLPGLKLEIE
jgi:hypothetical protein